MYQVGFITQVDNIIYDARLRFTMPDVVDDRIVILDIDEKSLAVPELGRWPWGRDRVAALIQKLFDKYGVVIIGFDVVFAESDSSSGLKVLDQLAKREFAGNAQFAENLNRLRPQLDHDGAFALRQAPATSIPLSILMVFRGASRCWPSTRGNTMRRCRWPWCAFC